MMLINDLFKCQLVIEYDAGEAFLDITPSNDDIILSIHIRWTKWQQNYRP